MLNLYVSAKMFFQANFLEGKPSPFYRFSFLAFLDGASPSVYVSILGILGHLFLSRAAFSKLQSS